MDIKNISELSNHKIQDVLDDLGMIGQLHLPEGRCLSKG